MLPDGKQATGEAKEIKVIAKQAASDIDKVKCSSFPSSLPLVLKSYREPVETGLTRLALSLRSVHKSEHCTKGSAQRNGSVVISR